NGNALQKTTSVVTIPVIFHVVLNTSQLSAVGGTAGLQDRASSQIAVINQDFAGLNPDSTNIPAGFKPYFGKSNIQFGLAHKKPDGSYTPGFEIVTTTRGAFDLDYNTAGSGDGFSDAKYTSTTGANAWDPGKYLNVWVINMTQ